MYSRNDYRYYLENRLIHSDDFLAHYGVQGMHWGVRKAEAYRSKELSILDKTYENRMNKRAKRQTKIDKKLSKKPKNIKLTEKSVRNKNAQKYINAMYKTERKNLQKMSVEDLQAEKKAITKQHIKDAAISGAVTAGTFGLAAAGVSPGALVYVRRSDDRGMKSNSRVSPKEVYNIKKKYGETPKEYRPIDAKSDSAYKRYRKIQDNQRKKTEEKLDALYKKGAIDYQEYSGQKKELKYW